MRCEKLSLLVYSGFLVDSRNRNFESLNRSLFRGIEYPSSECAEAVEPPSRYPNRLPGCACVSARPPMAHHVGIQLPNGYLLRYYFNKKTPFLKRRAVPDDDFY